jgi:hypothetical protein
VVVTPTSEEVTKGCGAVVTLSSEEVTKIGLVVPLLPEANIATLIQKRQIITVFLLLPLTPSLNFLLFR